MAATAISLQLKTKHTTFRNPTFLRLFSSSSTPDSSIPDDPTPTSSSQSQSQSQSSYFTDVKASLKNQDHHHHHQQQQPRKPFFPSPPFQTPTTVASLEEIRKNLAEFRSKSAAPPPRDKSHSSQHSSFHELYSRNVISKSEEPSTAAGNESNKLAGRNKLSFNSIRESLSQLRVNKNNNNINNMMSLSNYKQTLKMRPVDGPAMVIGGADNLPSSVFGKEMKQKEKESPAAMKMEFVRIYDYPELGEMLRKLRPETTKGENWFSLGELNERLIKLREMEEKESESGNGGLYKDLRDSLKNLQTAEVEKNKKQTIQRLNVWNPLDGTPDFMLKPPKEPLVERYFHPDNMSSSEKLKLELQKVRDEFKMSESDCGSARVQVAQLTTKIKHLSTVLHKKDKHSKKGLQAMVQRRKKLLKYLRRTDWDSYCLLLSKLGLRDNPDYKNLT